MIANSHARRVIDDIVARLKKEYQPEKIILFGSYAYGKPTRDSDIDLFIIKDTGESPFQRRLTVRRICHAPDHRIPFQPLVVTPSEWTECLEMGDPFFREVQDKGETLYAKRQRVAASKGLVHESRARYGRVDVLLAINDEEGAGFHLQQAAEKYLKGYLLGRGWQSKRTHDLEDLIDDAVQFDIHFEEFREACRFSGEFYVSERYPFPLVSVPPRAQFDAAMSKIKEMISYITKQTPLRKP